MRLDLQRSTFPASQAVPGYESLVVHGEMHHQTWWARTGADIATNGGDMQRQYGVEDLDVLLRPDAIARGFVLHAARVAEVGGRRALEVEATPASPRDAFFLAVPGLVALGATAYALTVDRATGIVLGVAAYVQGGLARRTTIVDLSVDPPVAAGVFDPPVAPVSVS